MIKLRIIFTVLLFPILFVDAQINENHHLEAASKTVVNWFNNLNISNFDACYEEMSFEIKNKVDSLDFINMVDQEMISFGEFQGRKEISRKFAMNPTTFDERLVGFPDGYYAEFVFVSSYENWNLSKTRIETLFLHQDYKSRWRVLSYYNEFDFKDGVETEGLSD